MSGVLDKLNALEPPTRPTVRRQPSASDTEQPKAEKSAAAEASPVGADQNFAPVLQVGDIVSIGSRKAEVEEVRFSAIHGDKVFVFGRWHALSELDQAQ